MNRIPESRSAQQPTDSRLAPDLPQSAGPSVRVDLYDGDDDRHLTPASKQDGGGVAMWEHYRQRPQTIIESDGQGGSQQDMHISTPIDQAIRVLYIDFNRENI